MTNKQPIGIFDSGVGGTSIFKEIYRLMPLEKTIYLADSKNAPYGIRSKQEIIELCYKNTELLLSLGCKLIVVACNTATTNAIKHLRQKYDIPFIGIEPAIKPAALNSSKKCIGVLATQGTLTSQLFSETSKLFAHHIEVIEVQGNSLVEAIEAGKENDPSTLKHLKTILSPILKKDTDFLVLGCTHYPYLIPQLRKILPEKVRIIDSSRAVAKQTQAVLQSLGLLAKTQQEAPVFYTNKDVYLLRHFISEYDFEVKYLNF